LRRLRGKKFWCLLEGDTRADEDCSSFREVGNKLMLGTISWPREQKKKKNKRRGVQVFCSKSGEKGVILRRRIQLILPTTKEKGGIRGDEKRKSLAF